MLLLSTLLHQFKVQRSPVVSPLSDPAKPTIQAPVLAKVLAGNPKLMIELAIELTKLAQKDCL